MRPQMRSSAYKSYSQRMRDWLRRRAEEQHARDRLAVALLVALAQEKGDAVK